MSLRLTINNYRGLKDVNWMFIGRLSFGWGKWQWKDGAIERFRVAPHVLPQSNLEERSVRVSIT